MNHFLKMLALVAVTTLTMACATRNTPNPSGMPVDDGPTCREPRE